eukprot:Phypoly_transcript_18409.p1 GENE.Phypoly_transcript_18409~~Phypoly_transcript_18409.p1  ORF type:complete len:228 (+),score=29.36 Phypoly_transcript_18409:66-749(+)
MLLKPVGVVISLHCSTQLKMMSCCVDSSLFLWEEFLLPTITHTEELVMTQIPRRRRRCQKAYMPDLLMSLKLIQFSHTIIWTMMCCEQACLRSSKILNKCLPVAESIREILLEHNLFPELILTITTSHIKDASLFLGSIVVSHQPHRYQWLKDYIETENNSNHNHETDAVDVTPIYHKNNSNNNTSSSGNGNSSNSTAYNALQAALQHSLSQSFTLRIAFHSNCMLP